MPDLQVMLAGQRWLGRETLAAIAGLPGVRVAAVVCPIDDAQLRLAAWRIDALTMVAGTLSARTMPPAIDLIVAAHSHDFIGEKTRLRARHGAIGYHPSLLPLHRGRDAIRWAIRMGDRVTGGTVYRLTNRMDGGPVLAQRHVFIRPGDTPEELWRRDLGPLGVRMLAQAVADIAAGRSPPGVSQDEALATWEPSIGRPPAFRPDLILLPPADHGQA